MPGPDRLLDLLDASLQITELVCHGRHRDPCMWRDAAIDLVSDDADQLRYPPDTQRGNNSELAETAADQIGEHGLLLDQDFPGAVERESRLLLDRFDRRKPHRRTAYGLADRRGIEGVALPALHIRLYIAGRHHPHLVTERGQFSRPVMRGRTGFDADQAGWQRGEEAQHLADLKTQAAAGAIDLVFLDESEALTHSYLARCWAQRGTELRIQAPGQAKKRAMLGAFDPVHRRLLVHTSPTKRSTDFLALLDQLGAAYGTAERTRPLVAVLDNGPIHTSKLTTKALAARPWLTLEWLPKYAPELNDIERCWRDLKQHQLANRTFADADALARAIPDAVARLNHERQLKSSPIRRRAA